MQLAPAFDVQSASIHGIFGCLYGKEKISRLARHDACRIARLAARDLRREMGAPSRASATPSQSDIRIQAAILTYCAREKRLLITKLPADYHPNSNRDYSPLCYLERLELTNRGWQITSRMASW